MPKILRHFSRKTIDDTLLRKLWPTRLPDKVIAERMGHHVGVLRRRASKIGLPLRRDLWKEGAT